MFSSVPLAFALELLIPVLSAIRRERVSRVRKIFEWLGCDSDGGIIVDDARVLASAGRCGLPVSKPARPGALTAQQVAPHSIHLRHYANLVGLRLDQEPNLSR